MARYDLTVSTSAGRPRRSGAADGDSDALALHWAEIEERLLRSLGALGCSSEDAADVIQEVAVRAIRSRVSCTGPDDFMRWGSTVARHLYIDGIRRRSRERLHAEVPELPSGDVEGEVQARVRWGAVQQLLVDLPTEDLRSLVEPQPGSGRREQTRLAVRRRRLRQRLLAATGGPLAIATAAWRRLRATFVVALVASTVVLAVIPPGGGAPPPASAPTSRQVAIIVPASVGTIDGATNANASKPVANLLGTIDRGGVSITRATAVIMAKFDLTTASGEELRITFSGIRRATGAKLMAALGASPGVVAAPPAGAPAADEPAAPDVREPPARAARVPRRAVRLEPDGPTAPSAEKLGRVPTKRMRKPPA